MSKTKTYVAPFEFEVDFEYQGWLNAYFSEKIMRKPGWGDEFMLMGDVPASSSVSMVVMNENGSTSYKITQDELNIPFPHINRNWNRIEFNGNNVNGVMLTFKTILK